MTRVFPKPIAAATTAVIIMASLLLASMIVVVAQDTTPPEVLSHFPYERQSGMSLDVTLYVNFSEPMNLANLSWAIDPFVNLNGNLIGTTLILTHVNPFNMSTKYTVTVNGSDLAGNWLDGDYDGVGGESYSFIFWTDCGGPCIIETLPADGDVEIPTDMQVIVYFSNFTGPSVTITITPYAGPYSQTWFNGLFDQRILYIQHADFQYCENYTVEIIDGSLVPGPVPNPWSFTTFGCEPVIVDIDPPQVNAQLDAQIKVDFSRSMNVSATTWTLEPLVTLNSSWHRENKTLELNHTEKFRPCWTYNLTIAGEDANGNPLVPGSIPNPYEFHTICTHPRVTGRLPLPFTPNAPLDAPIIITFSETMDNKSVEDSFSYTDGITRFTISAGTVSWDDNVTVFTYTPSIPYQKQTAYTVLLNSSIAKGLGENHLDGNQNNIEEFSPIDDVSWQFTTMTSSDVTPPQVTTTQPADGARNVSRDVTVVVIFSEAMNKFSVESSSVIVVLEGTTAYGLPYDFYWPNNATVQFHIIPMLEYATQYTVRIMGTVSDLVGNQMGTEYSWSFTVEYWRGNVYGRVIDADDGTPVVNAMVTLNGIQTVTDANGNFTLNNVQQGTYTLNVSKNGYDQNSTVFNIGPEQRNLGAIVLRKTPPSQASDGLWIVILLLLTFLIVFFVILFLISRRRRGMQPTRFEEWKGEVAVVERDQE